MNTGSFQVYQVEQQVRVIYLPADLKSARIADRMRWVSPWLVICFGLVFAALTVLPQREGRLYHVVGPEPCGPVQDVQPLPPTLEDGYVWLRQASKP